MAVNYTTSLGLGQPVTGTESGTWGDDVNNAVTSYLDIAIAGGLAVSITTADVTLVNTFGTSSATNITSNTAQYAILNISGAKTAARSLIVPSSSRYYLINNSAATGGFLLTVKGDFTSGVTLVDGEKAIVAWNGTDYVKIASSTLSSLTGVLPIASGGTNTQTTPTAGGVGYGTGTAYGFTAVGTSGQLLTSAGAGAPVWANAPVTVQIQTISASAASNALTISAPALTLDFRSTTLGSGTITTVSGTPANLVIPAGATLGSSNGVLSRLYVIALNNAGTIELAVANLYSGLSTSSGGLTLDETTLLSTTIMSVSSSSSGVAYSTTARTNLAYRVIGYIQSTQATAGQWATAPSAIQGVGGQALINMNALGYGQVWQGGGSFGTTYYNTTGRPIMVSFGGATYGNTVTVGGVGLSTAPGNPNYYPFAQSFIVPPGLSYYVMYNTSLLQGMQELR